MAEKKQPKPLRHHSCGARLTKPGAISWNCDAAQVLGHLDKGRPLHDVTRTGSSFSDPICTSCKEPVEVGDPAGVTDQPLIPAQVTCLDPGGFVSRPDMQVELGAPVRIKDLLNDAACFLENEDCGKAVGGLFLEKDTGRFFRIGIFIEVEEVTSPAWAMEKLENLAIDCICRTVNPAPKGGCEKCALVREQLERLKEKKV
jgi:hypothetical protein